MRKLLAVNFLLCFISWSKLNAQTYNINYSELTIINLSISINYSGSNYSSPYTSTWAQLNTLQQKFDFYKGMVEKEYGRLMSFDLLNESNRLTLNAHKVLVRIYFEQNDMSRVDWSQNSNFAHQLVNYISSIYNFAEIKSEISLLKAVYAEYNRLKAADPDNFYKSARYNELGLVLTTLKTCNPSEIGKLAFTYGLW